MKHRGRVGNSLHKKHRWIGFLGATIVLATFLVKEERRDGIKAELEDLNNEETTFLTRNETYDIRVALLRIQMKLLPNEGEEYITHPKKEKTPEEKDYVDDLMQGHQMMPMLSLAMDNLRRFAAALPLPDDEKKRVNSLDTIYAHLIEIQATPVKNNAESLRAADDDYERTQSLLWYGGNSAKNNLIRFADSAREDKEAQLRKWNFWSNMLFGLGWLMGLVGKWYGEDDDSSE